MFLFDVTQKTQQKPTDELSSLIGNYSKDDAKTKHAGKDGSYVETDGTYATLFDKNGKYVAHYKKGTEITDGANNGVTADLVKMVGILKSDQAGSTKTTGDDQKVTKKKKKDQQIGPKINDGSFYSKDYSDPVKKLHDAIVDVKFNYEGDRKVREVKKDGYVYYAEQNDDGWVSLYRFPEKKPGNTDKVGFFNFESKDLSYTDKKGNTLSNLTDEQAQILLKLAGVEKPTKKTVSGKTRGTEGQEPEVEGNGEEKLNSFIQNRMAGLNIIWALEPSAYQAYNKYFNPLNPEFADRVAMIMTDGEIDEGKFVRKVGEITGWYYTDGETYTLENCGFGEDARVKDLLDRKIVRADDCMEKRTYTDYGYGDASGKGEEQTVAFYRVDRAIDQAAASKYAQGIQPSKVGGKYSWAREGDNFNEYKSVLDLALADDEVRDSLKYFDYLKGYTVAPVNRTSEDYEVLLGELAKLKAVSKIEVLAAIHEYDFGNVKKEREALDASYSKAGDGNQGVKNAEVSFYSLTGRKIVKTAPQTKQETEQPEEETQTNNGEENQPEDTRETVKTKKDERGDYSFRDLKPKPNVVDSTPVTIQRQQRQTRKTETTVDASAQLSQGAIVILQNGGVDDWLCSAWNDPAVQNAYASLDKPTRSLALRNFIDDWQAMVDANVFKEKDKTLTYQNVAKYLNSYAKGSSTTTVIDTAPKKKQEEQPPKKEEKQAAFSGAYSTGTAWFDELGKDAGVQSAFAKLTDTEKSDLINWAKDQIKNGSIVGEGELALTTEDVVQLINGRISAR